jgi:NADPH:quinone reductase-like Zn-dependent oxidoreductase
VVRAVGAAVSRFRVGDQVLTHAVPLQHQGAWAEMLVVPEGQAAHKPAAAAVARCRRFRRKAATSQ